MSHKWRSAATEPAIECPTARAVCLVALRAKSVALRSDESRARRLTAAILHGTSPQGEQSSTVGSRRSANG